MQMNNKEQKKKMIGLTVTKKEDFFAWYEQIITRAELIEYYGIKGCYVLRPQSMGIWNSIRKELGNMIDSLGVQEAYFPLFVTKDLLEKEQNHIEGFEAEVAWITKYGSSDLSVPIAIRPTSETIMYPYFAKWIRSHRDLPLMLNQWCNVVRWEFSHPQPFIRTREFLWQEGHCAFRTKEEAEENVTQALGFYESIYSDILAIPVLRGTKSENEKFAGSMYSKTIEAIIPETKKGIQAATSHCLGQNFSKMFGITYEEDALEEKMDSMSVNENKKYVWQTCWGFTTRSIGIMVMVHGDDRGLVLPPKAAQNQAVIIPCGISKDTSEEMKMKIKTTVGEIAGALKGKGIRVCVDDRDNYTVGWKFNHWELMGVPLRIEIGPKDVEKRVCRGVYRVDHTIVSLDINTIAEETQTHLEELQHRMYENAKKKQEAVVKTAETMADVLKNMKDSILYAPWCTEVDCEKEIKIKTRPAEAACDATETVSGIKSLCIPEKQPQEVDGKKCFNCGKDAIKYGLFGRSY